MGEGCLAGPSKCRHNSGSVELLSGRACLRGARCRQPLCQGPAAPDNRSGWKGGVARPRRMASWPPAQVHEQAVTSGWRVGAQPRHVLARLRGALTMQFFPVRPLCSRSPPPGMTAMLPGGCSSRAPQWQRQPSPWRGKVGGQLGRTPWCVYACVCDMAVLCAGPSLTITVKHQPQLDSGGPEQNKQVDSSVHRHA